MYYYRDSYFDRQIAYDIASSARRRPAKSVSASKKAWQTTCQVFLSLLSMAVTFALSYMVLDVLGLEHLVQVPEFDGLIETLEMFKPTDIAF